MRLGSSSFIQIVICFVIPILFFFVDTDNCSQGSFDLFTLTFLGSAFLIICFIALKLYYYRRSREEESKIFLILTQTLSAIVLIIQLLPYVVNTTIKRIAICQGSSTWGGFGNKFGFDSLPSVNSTFERFLPVYFMVIPVILISFAVFEIFHYKTQDKLLKKQPKK